MMLRALLMTVVLSQTLYEWVDSKGESHFTDDPGSIPRGVKSKVTSGAPLNTVSGDDAGPSRAVKPTPTPAPTVGPDSCARAKAQVADVEKRLAQVKPDQEAAQAKERARCQGVLRTLGQPAWARCMAGVQEAAPATPTAPLEQELDRARETLRRAQVEGCH